MENFEGDNDLQMCGGCGKRFERKAALHSHSALCSKRIAICNTLSVNRSKRSHDDSAAASKIEERIEKISTKSFKATLPREKANIVDVYRTRGSSRRKPNILKRRVTPQKNPPPPKEQEKAQEEAKPENTTPIVVSDDDDDVGGNGEGIRGKEEEEEEDTGSAEKAQEVEEEEVAEVVPQESAPLEKEEAAEEEEEETERTVPKSASPEVSIVLPDVSKALPQENSREPPDRFLRKADPAAQPAADNSTADADKSKAALRQQEELYKIIGIAMSSDDSPEEETVPISGNEAAVTVVEDPDVVYVHDSTTDDEYDVEDIEEEEEEEEKELQALFEEDDDEESEKPDVHPLGSDILDAAADMSASNTSSEVVEETPVDPTVDAIVLDDEIGLIPSDDDSGSSLLAPYNRHKRKRSPDSADACAGACAGDSVPLGPFKRRFSSMDLATHDSNFVHAPETLDQRMSSYVNVEHSTCNHCELKFPEIEALRAHMALHFNWYRYQCDLCEYKCYLKGPTFTHVLNKHKIRTVEQIEAAIFDIPEWKSARYCSQTFIEILAQSPREEYDDPPAFLAVEVKDVEEDAEHFLADVKEEDDEGVEEEEEVEMFSAVIDVGAEDEEDEASLDLKLSGSSCEALPDMLEPDMLEPDMLEPDVPELDVPEPEASEPEASEPEVVKEEHVLEEAEHEHEEEEKKDPEMFKMVMEVIFGSANSSAGVAVKEEAPSSPDALDLPSKESSTSPVEAHLEPKSRPIRQRTPCVHKDFLYDMSSLMRGKVSSASNALGDVRGVSKATNRKGGSKFCPKINRGVENKVQYPVVPKLRLRKCEEIYVRCDEKMDDSNS